MTDNSANITISDSAAKRIAELMGKEENPNSMLRVSVDGGGCSGFQYKFDFDDKKNDDDQVFKKDGAVVIIDEVSRGFLENAQIDFVDTLGASHFEIKNPQASSTCGCGNSFAV